MPTPTFTLDASTLSIRFDPLLLFCFSHSTCQVKTASLPWHSPLLNDISSAKSWLKIYTGLVRMYRENVVAKLPIMQHFFIGRLIGNVGGQQDEAVGDGQWQCAPFVSVSGGHADPTDHHHECLHHAPSDDAQTLVEDGDTPPPVDVEGVVKYVKGASGQWIPIKASTTDVYAMGQERPSCCGMRVPSAFGALKARQNNTPAFRRGMIPFD
jgi:hypothetical protein